MSQIRVNDIRDSGGSNSSTPAQIANGRAKVWVNWNGSGTVAIRADYGVNSVTDNATEQYTVNFSSAFSDANYCACYTTSSATSTWYTFSNVHTGNGGTNLTANSSNIRVLARSLNSAADCNYNMLACWR